MASHCIAKHNAAWCSLAEYSIPSHSIANAYAPRDGYQRRETRKGKHMAKKSKIKALKQEVASRKKKVARQEDKLKKAKKALKKAA